MSVLIYFGMMISVVLFGFVILGITFYQYLETKKKQQELK